VCICHRFIGGSEVFELLSTRQYGRGCARALGYRKLQVPEDFPERISSSRRALFARGHRFEDVAAQMYMELTGRKLIRQNNLRLHPDYPGAGVHTDRIVLADDRHSTGDVEIKTHAEGPFLHILREGLPVGHMLQLQWSLWITGHAWGAFIVLGFLPEAPLKYFDIEADPETFEIFAREHDRFWDLVDQGKLPEPLEDPNDVRCKLCPWRLSCRGEQIDPAELQRIMHEKKTPLKVIVDDELAQACEDYTDTRDEIEDLTHESEDPMERGTLQLITQRIKELVGDLPGVIVNRQWKVLCTDGSWSGLDQQRLKQEQPEIYEKYFIRGKATGGKRLTVSSLEKKRRR
jgi:predicted phage-related endonuclease